MNLRSICMFLKLKQQLTASIHNKPNPIKDVVLRKNVTFLG